ncbi:MAG: hypothetical protein K6U89_06520, partial [Chloroflexi bacterium]|nr:hypothetical protein [Chloroflexota bacterium]
CLHPHRLHRWHAQRRPGGKRHGGQQHAQATGGFAGTPANQRYTLVSAPSNGTLKLGGTSITVGSILTQQDGNDGNVNYQHNGSASASDSFSVKADDGVGGSDGPKRVAVNVTPTPTATPTPGGGGSSRTSLAITSKNF